MVFKVLCVLCVLWMKVASALEGLASLEPRAYDQAIHAGFCGEKMMRVVTRFVIVAVLVFCRGEIDRAASLCDWSGELRGFWRVSQSDMTCLTMTS